MNENYLKKALLHTLTEVEFPNMVISLKNNYETMQKAHDSIHEFILLASISLPSQTKVSWHSKSAFLTYQWEAFHSAHRSFLEALAGYYNAAFTLLRSTLELTIKGAFFECLAHKEFREKSEVLDKDERGKRLKDTINDAIGEKMDLEETSATIHDMLMVDVDGRVFVEQPEYRPSVKTVSKQLSSWGMLDPIEKPTETLYGIYKMLSADVHVIPDKTDIGRRLLSQRNLFETDIIPDELSRYVEFLHKIMDISIVVELNILSDWIIQNKKVQSKLKERLTVLEDLGLEFSAKRLRGLMKDEQ